MRVYTWNKNSDNQSEAIAIIGPEMDNLMLHQTYNKFGIQYECADASAWIESISPEFIAMYGDDNIYAFDNPLFDEIEASSFQESIDYNILSPAVVGHNYWDLNNWRTIVLSHEHTENRDIDRVNPYLEDKILDAWYNDAEQTLSNFATTKYLSQDYNFIESNYYGAVFIEVYENEAE